MVSKRRGTERRRGSRAGLSLLLLLSYSIIANGAVTKQQIFASEPQLAESSLHPSIVPERTAPMVHLSHSGVYLDSLISRNAPHYLTLSVASPLYDVESVRIITGKSKQRNWEQTHLECGGLDAGGIEACEADDLREVDSLGASSDITCEPYKIIPSQARVLINTRSCPSLSALLSVKPESIATETYLDSVTLSFEIKRRLPTRKEKHSFWIGRLVRAPRHDSDGGALWPYARQRVNDTQSNPFPWNGHLPNAITTQMQDPYMPKAYKTEAADVMNGVDLVHSAWSLGISVLSPTNRNVSTPLDRKYEAVHAPVGGQIVWMGEYVIPMAPSNHRNDESGYAIMVRSSRFI